jgi:uncharacterized phage infection (PIP) family protein YhgE
MDQAPAQIDNIFQRIFADVHAQLMQLKQDQILLQQESSQMKGMLERLTTDIESLKTWQKDVQHQITVLNPQVNAAIYDVTTIRDEVRAGADELRVQYNRVSDLLEDLADGHQ